MSRPHGITTGNAAGAAGGRFYLPQLDGLRFCAFLLVFLHHSPVFPGGSRAAAAAQGMGWVGVDLFFVLSAYLLIALLHQEHEATGATDFRKFFIRRALRIWPLFYVYVAACFVHFIATDGEDMAEVTGRTIGHLFLLDNFFTAFAGQYNPLNFTQHLWTVAFEEQVYLFIPLLFAAIVWLRRRQPLFALAAVAVVASQPLLRWALTLFHDDETTVWVIPFLHADTIIAGLLLGAGVGSTLKQSVPGDVFAIAGALVLGVVVFVLPARATSANSCQRRPFISSRCWPSRSFSSFLDVWTRDRGSPGSWHGGRWCFWGESRTVSTSGIWAGNQFGPSLARSWFSALVNLENPLVAWLFVVLSALSWTVAVSVLSYFVLERPFLRIKSRFTLVPNRAD